MNPDSFNDLGDDEHVVALGGGVLEGELDGQPALRDVLGPNIGDRKRVRRRFDAGHVDLLELLDVGNHIADLLGEPRLFLRRECEAGEAGDMVEVEVGGDGHGDGRKVGWWNGSR